MVLLSAASITTRSGTNVIRQSGLPYGATVIHSRCIAAVTRRGVASAKLELRDGGKSTMHWSYSALTEASGISGFVSLARCAIRSGSFPPVDNEVDSNARGACRYPLLSSRALF